MNFFVCFILTTSLSAAVTFYQSGNDFLAAAGPAVTQNFNGVPNGSYGTASGFTAGGVNVVGRCTAVTTVPIWCDYSLGVNNGEVQGPLGLYAYPSFHGAQHGDLVVTFSSPVRSAGFDYAHESSNPFGNLVLLLNGGESSPTMQAANGQSGFWGFVSDVGVTGFTLRAMSPSFEYSFVRFDNLLYEAGGDSSVPEPGSWALVVGALLAGMVVRRGKMGMLLLAPLVAFGQAPQYVIRTVAGFLPPAENVPATSVVLESPFSVAAGRGGEFYVSTSGAGGVLRVDASGVIRTFALGTIYQDMKVDAAGNVYGVSQGLNRVNRISVSGEVSVLAGDGTRGYAGDGGPATAARFASPSGIAMDGAGNVYIADWQNYRVRKITADGVIRTIAGTGVNSTTGDGGAATAATLRPVSVAVDADGNVYAAESTSPRIRKITPAGQISTVAGNGINGTTRPGPALNTPLNGNLRLVAGEGGRLYFSEESGSSVWSLEGGNLTLIAGGRNGFGGDGGLATAASLSGGRGLDLDNSGRLLVADMGNSRIRRIVRGGQITTVAGLGHFAGDGGPGVDAILGSPGQMALDGAGGLLFADTANQRIRRLSVDGTITTVAGNGGQQFAGDGGQATAASLYLPRGIAMAADGTLYIADNLNRRIRRVRSGGTIETYAGTGLSSNTGDGGQARAATMGNVYDLAVDRAGTIYFSDTTYHRVRKIDGQGIITNYAGTGAGGFSGDGGLATSAQMTSPRALAMDKDGNLYIGENNRIRKVTPGGIITTVVGNGQAGAVLDGVPANSAIATPNGITVDSQGNLIFVYGVYVGMLSGGRLQRIAGSGFSGSSGDGGVATAASFRNLSSLVVDAEGDVYVADSGNHSIRRLTRNSPESLEILGGNGQQGVVNSLLPEALRVRVMGRAKAAAAGVSVRFVLEMGLATLSAATSVTDVSGIAGIGVTLGREAGEATIRAEVAGVEPVRFTVTATEDGSAVLALEPRIAEGGVVSAGPNRIAALAPRALMLVRGEGFAVAGLERRVTEGDLPGVLDGVCVEAGGQRGLIRSVTATQLEWVAPELAAGGSVQVEVITGCDTEAAKRSNAVGVLVQSAIPEFVAAEDVTGASYAVRVADAESGEVLQTVKAGQRVHLFAMGIGGETDVLVSVGGEAATVISAAPVAGQIGIVRIECRLPESGRSGEQPLVVRAGEIASPAGAYLRY